MAVHVAMLRAINLGPRRRVAMAELRRLLGDAGYGDVRTYVQSGNIILRSRAAPAELERALPATISERFGFDVPVIVRSHAQLARIVERNELGDVAEDPKRYQVSFLAGELAPDVIDRLQAQATGSEQVVVAGREIYSWHPEGAARSKLATAVSGAGLGVVATARNWTTVTTLLRMAGEP